MPILRLVKKALKGIPGVGSVIRRVERKFRASPLDGYSNDSLSARSTDELMAIMRHEAHRIEKSMYNNIFETKKETYSKKRDRIEFCLEILRGRGVALESDPCVVWVRQIIDAFDDLNSFIEPNSSPPEDFDATRAAGFVEFVKKRRSVRVWAEQQPSREQLEVLAEQMIDAARWAPTSGNRQAWRFVVLIDPEDKEMLRGVKEEHCISSPLLIYVAMDRRVYGALGENETSLYIDAGAAIMQMVLTAHDCGLGVCWNHFAMDMITSRPSNLMIYNKFAERFNIPDYFTPIAIVATGIPKFIPPQPARREISDLKI